MKTTDNKAKNIKVEHRGLGDYVVEYTLDRCNMVYSRWFSSQREVKEFLASLTGKSFVPPMVTIDPPTPVTAKDRIQNVIVTLDRAIEHMKRNSIHHTPLWSDLNHARMEAVVAYNTV